MAGELEQADEHRKRFTSDVARELVRAHGGEITIERPAKGGTRLLITLAGARE